MDGRFDVKFVSFDESTGTIKLNANYVPHYPIHHISIDINREPKMNDAELALLQALMFQQGVLPIEQVRHDMRRMLDQLPPDEARKLKRKFRKLWRKLARSEHPENLARPLGRNLRSRIYGEGKVHPTRDNFEARKRLVRTHFLTDLIRPILDKYETGQVQRSEEPT